MKYIHNGPLALAVALLAIGTILPLNLGALALLTLAGYIIYRANADDVKRSKLIDDKINITREVVTSHTQAVAELKAECEALAQKLAETEATAKQAAAHAQQVDTRTSFAGKMAR